ncbi:hypothetical protein IKG48_00830, partial [Candidatus Saccharibacteria bacterium]|nr:hypothetical protein [Candidatus Saccharibacteria bacterium]
ASVNVPCDLSTTAPTSCANGTIDSTTITFGANISDSLPAGRYTNDVVFTAISNVPETRVAYTLNYNVNGGTGSISPTHAAYPGTTGFASGSSLTPPSRSTFLGWALTSSATTPDYTPADTISTLSLIEDAIAAGQSISETQGGVIQLYAVWEETVQNCSASVHPTTSEGCKMADNKIWILGNNGNSITWDNMFTDATGADNHNATVNSGICPAGYSAPTIVDYDNLVIAYGGTSISSGRNGYLETTGALYSMLGLSGYRAFWSSTEYNSYNAYSLGVNSGRSGSSDFGSKSYDYYVLCYK